MAEIYRVEIEFRPRGEKLLIMPEKIRVPQHSVIQWNIMNYDNRELLRHYRMGLTFTIYFQDKSPFSWKRQFIQVHRNSPFFRPYQSRTIRLAEEVADEKGDYKYGVRVSKSEHDETVYDEDPYLSVY